MQEYGGEIYDHLDNLSLHQMNCQEREFKLILLSPSSLAILQHLSWHFRGVRQLPFLHFVQMPSIFIIDHDNSCGLGPRALIQMAHDRRKSLLVSPSISDFLGTHVQRLKANWYNNLRGGMIESFAKNASDPGAFGSVKVTKGIRVSACAIYNHLHSQFESVSDAEAAREDHLLFVYQIKIEEAFDQQPQSSDPKTQLPK